jgi:hypothetical protein
VGTFGNVGRDSVQAPAYFQVDAALVRDFRVREGLTLQLRAEAFNLPNSRRSGIAPPSLQAGASGLNLTLGTGGAPGTIGAFGTQTSSLDPRIVQMALKIVF